MNSMQENNNQAQTTSNFMAELRKKNQTTIQKMEDIPYSPTIYAIRKDHWDAMIQLLKDMEHYHSAMWDTLETLPTRTKVIEQNTQTWEAVNDWAGKMTNIIIEAWALLMSE